MRYVIQTNHHAFFPKPKTNQGMIQMIIGLTGGSGTGKSYASEIFEKNGFTVIDFDRVSRDVCDKGSTCLSEITEVFGKEILNPDFSLNRKKLGEIVFADKEKLEILTRITHKHILIETNRIMDEKKDKNLLFDAPLLFEAELDKKCDYVISVLADREKRIDRISKRDSLSLENAENRVSSQPEDDFYISKSDFFVYNNSTEEEFKNQIFQILRSIINETQGK